MTKTITELLADMRTCAASVEKDDGTMNHGEIMRAYADMIEEAWNSTRKTLEAKIAGQRKVINDLTGRIKYVCEACEDAGNGVDLGGNCLHCKLNIEAGA